MNEIQFFMFHFRYHLSWRSAPLKMENLISAHCASQGIYCFSVAEIAQFCFKGRNLLELSCNDLKHDVVWGIVMYGRLAFTYKVLSHIGNLKSIELDFLVCLNAVFIV